MAKKSHKRFIIEFAIVLTVAVVMVIVLTSFFRQQLPLPGETHIIPDRETSRWNASYPTGTKLDMRNKIEAESFAEYRYEKFGEEWEVKYHFIPLPPVRYNYVVRVG